MLIGAASVEPVKRRPRPRAAKTDLQRMVVTLETQHYEAPRQDDSLKGRTKRMKGENATDDDKELGS